MSEEKKIKLAGEESNSAELSEKDLDNVAGGGAMTYTIQSEYTKQEDTGAAKGTVATKVDLGKAAGPPKA